MNLIQWLIIAALMAVQSMAMQSHGHGTRGEQVMADEGVSASVEARMIGLYAAAADDVAKMAGKAALQLLETPELASANFRAARAAELERAIRDRMARLGAQLPTMIDGPAKAAIEQAIKVAEREMKDLGLDPKNARPGVAGSVSFAVVDDGAVRKIAEDSAARAASDIQRSLGEGAADNARRAVQVFRTLSASAANVRGGGEVAINKAIARGLITGNPTVADRSIREMFREPGSADSVRKLGNRQIEVGKTVMSVRAYAATVVRTRTREATVAARHERLGASGLSLVQIVGKNSANFCTAFLGLVCSLSGEQTIDGVTYPALASLPGGGPPFHPNCSKSTAAYVVELVSAGRVAAHEKASIEFRKREATGRLTDPVKSK